ncbi:MAG: paraquat-inducible protein A [Desulfobacterales bacterium]|nr:paraquat-inducible protein A [Desulfobacterales bacterium]
MNNRLILISFNIISAACLVAAFCYPFMYSEFSLELPDWLPDFLAARTQEWIIQKGNIPTGPHYLFEIIRNLFLAREFLVGIAIALFSIGFPFIKIGLVFFLTLFGHKLEATFRHRLLTTLNSVSKWSMADVFIVGMLIVFMKAEGFHFRFTADAGLYFYAAAAVVSAISFHLLMHLPPDRQACKQTTNF